MKLVLRKDLGPIRERALSDIDARFSTAPSLLGDIYAAKYALAQQRHELLEAEAIERGLSVEELSTLILSRREASDKRLIEIDHVRRELKARILNATSEEEIRRALTDAESLSFVE